jgi:hypothetical protein
MQVVLEWRAGQQQALLRVKLTQSTRNLAVFIFEFVSFINDDVLPCEFLERAHAKAYTLEGGKTDIEFARLEVVLESLLTLFFRCNQVEHSDLRTPQFEFLLPVWNHGLWDNNQEVALYLLEFAQKCQERDGLDGFAETLKE